MSPSSDTPGSSASVAVRPVIRTSIALLLLVAGVALGLHALYTAIHHESVDPSLPVTALADPAEIAARGREAIGTYATGEQTGDRVITITAEGKIKFLEIGSKDDFANNTDTFTLGRRDKYLSLVTAVSGVVEFRNLDTLVYYRDTYRRTH